MRSPDVNKLELQNKIDSFFGTLSRSYEQNGNKLLQKIIVNSQIIIEEDRHYENCYDERDTFAIYLSIPEIIYLDIIKKKEAIEELLLRNIGEIFDTQREFIVRVNIELSAKGPSDWRKMSGLLLEHKHVVLPEAKNRIWGQAGYRVFLSHKAEVKKEAVKLKEKLGFFGISCFVAHEDIHPTKEWQNEIENALFSMQAFVAFMTEEFHNSLWTDQEVGVAFGRSVPMISVKLGADPYGFIGKFQALTCPKEKTALEIVKVLIKQEPMLNAYINKVKKCDTFENGNIFSDILPSINELSDQQVNDLITAYNDNYDLKGSFGFNGSRHKTYGLGLLYHLNRLTGQSYIVNPDSGDITVS